MDSGFIVIIAWMLNNKMLFSVNIIKIMVFFPTLFSIIEVISVMLPVLLGVAFVTVAERKTMASMQSFKL